MLTFFRNSIFLHTLILSYLSRRLLVQKSPCYN